MVLASYSICRGGHTDFLLLVTLEIVEQVKELRVYEYPWVCKRGYESRKNVDSFQLQYKALSHKFRCADELTFVQRKG